MADREAEDSQRLAVRMLLVELLDETVPAGELVRIVRSVCQSMREGDIYDGSPLRELAGRLTAELFEEIPAVRSAGRRIPPVGFYFCPICEREQRLTEPCEHITITEGYRPQLVELLRGIEAER